MLPRYPPTFIIFEKGVFMREEENKVEKTGLGTAEKLS